MDKGQRTVLGDVSSNVNDDVLAKSLPDKGSKAASGRRQRDGAQEGEQSQQRALLQAQRSFSGSHQQQQQQQQQQPQEAPLALAPGEGEDLLQQGWVDVDAQNRRDVHACAPYAQAIFAHLREAERQRRANPGYLEEVQKDMNSKMRAILVDWLVEVAEEYKLCADTLYLTVNYVDRLLSRVVVPRQQLQLVGVACMWVAAKYEEIYPPNVSDFCYITDSTYSKQQVVAMEETVLKKLNYELAVPTAKTFLRRLLQVCNPDELLHYLSNYLTELSLLDHIMMSFLPSEIAAAAVYLSNLMLRRPGWDGTLQHYSTYAPRDLLACTRALAQLHQAIAGNSQLAAIREKYMTPRFQAVSRVPLTPALMQQLGA